MTHTYKITGMTCEGCVAKVKSALLKTPGVLAAEVQLADPQATITMDTPLTASVLQQVLGEGKYTISASDEKLEMSSIAAQTGRTAYYPILLIFGYITGITLLVETTSGGFELMRWMEHFMASFFLLFSFFKLLNLKGFAEGYATYDIVARAIPAYGYVYPFIELLLGYAYLTGFEPKVTNIATLAVMGISSIGVIKSLVKNTPFQCACLGTIIKLPLSKVTLVEDLLMVAMSIGMLLLL